MHTTDTNNGRRRRRRPPSIPTRTAALAAATLVAAAAVGTSTLAAGPPAPTPAAEVIAEDPETFVNYYRVRIDPQKSEDIDKVLAFQFKDTKVGLHIRRGIAEFVADFSNYYRKPELVVALDGDTFAKLYLNSIDLAAAVKNGSAKVTQGGEKEVAELLDLFDKFNPAANVTIPFGNALEGMVDD